MIEKLKNKTIQALRWSERYTKTDMVYLAEGGFWAVLSQVLTATTTLVLAISFAHFVSKEDYGQYKYVLSIAGILGSFTLTGLGTSLVKSVAEGYEGTLKKAFWDNIRWSLLFIILALGTSVYYFANNNLTLGVSMLIVGSLFPIISSTNLYDSYLIGKKDFRRSAIYFNIIGSIFPSLCILITILFTQKVLWLVGIYFVSNTVIGVILYRKIINIHNPNQKIDSNALRYGGHLSLIGILTGIANNIDQVLVFHYIGPIELAIYNFAIAIPNQAKGLMKGLGGLILPKFSERSDSEIQLGMNNKFYIIFIVSILLIVVYIFLAPYIFQFLFPKYLDSVFYSQILSISFLAAVSIPAEMYLTAKKKVKEQYFNNIIMSISQIIVTYILVLMWGLMGVVISRVFIRLSRSLMTIILSKRIS